MFCNKCGKEITDDSKFCQYCGALQSMDVSGEFVAGGNIIVCPRCGSTNIHFVTIHGGQAFDKGDACCGYLLCGPIGLLCGVKDNIPTETVRKCMNCKFEF